MGDTHPPFRGPKKAAFKQFISSKFNFQSVNRVTVHQATHSSVPRHHTQQAARGSDSHPSSPLALPCYQPPKNGAKSGSTRRMGGRVSRLSRAVAGPSSQAATPSSTAATPPQFLAATKASAVIDASRRVLSDDTASPAEDIYKQTGSNPSHAVAAASNMRAARLQDALGRGGGGGHEGEGAVTDEQLRNAYSVQVEIPGKHMCPQHSFLCGPMFAAAGPSRFFLQGGHASRSVSDNAHIGKRPTHSTHPWTCSAPKVHPAHDPHHQYQRMHCNTLRAAASMNKIMNGLHVKSRIVSGAAVATTSRVSGVEAPDVFKAILLAAGSSSTPDFAELARAWKCDPEQVRMPICLHALV